MVSFSHCQPRAMDVSSEPLTLNQRVQGSSPCAPTKNINISVACLMVRQTPCLPYLSVHTVSTKRAALDGAHAASAVVCTRPASASCAASATSVSVSRPRMIIQEILISKMRV